MEIIPAKNILILSYFFPPCNKVGGRRWAKFGKYLAAKNHRIYVVCVNVPFSGTCPWEKDIKGFSSNIHRLPYIEHRPFYQVNKSPDSIAGKLRYRISWYKHKLFGKSAPANISQKYNDSLLTKASEIIKTRNIETVIVTGGPFDWCFVSLQLKKTFPDLTYLLDFRDFWTGGEVYKKLNKYEQEQEDQKELACIINSDFVFTPAELIAHFLKNKYSLHSEKIHVLSHAYDAAELPGETGVHSPIDKTITLAYGGILYSNMEPAITRLIELLRTMEETGATIKLDIYTFNPAYEQMFADAGLSHIVHYHKTIPPDQLFAIFASTDYLLQLRAGEALEQHFKSTKFYELIALRKPIVYFGPEGDVSGFLVKNKLGYSGNMPVKDLCEELVRNRETNYIPDRSFNTSQFDYSTVTKKLEKFL